jgi:hypothetical protein
VVILVHVRMIEKYRSDIWLFMSIGVVPGSSLDCDTSNSPIYFKYQRPEF